MRYLQGLKSVNERVRIGETNMWVYMDGIIHEIGAGEVHIEIDIGLDFWEVTARVSGNESERECERFKIIDKVLDIQGDMQDGDVLWEEAKAHAKWVIESMGRGISGASRCTESGFWFGDEKRLADQEVSTDTFTSMPASMKACHICDGDCAESGCLIGVRKESVNAGDNEKGVKTQPLFPFPKR